MAAFFRYRLKFFAAGCGDGTRGRNKCCGGFRKKVMQDGDIVRGMKRDETLVEKWLWRQIGCF